jgi:hypothetical protein
MVGPNLVCGSHSHLPRGSGLSRRAPESATEHTAHIFQQASAHIQINANLICGWVHKLQFKNIAEIYGEVPGATVVSAIHRDDARGLDTQIALVRQKFSPSKIQKRTLTGGFDTPKV